MYGFLLVYKFCFILFFIKKIFLDIINVYFKDGFGYFWFRGNELKWNNKDVGDILKWEGFNK